jgi:hypothetical protein
MLYMPGNGDEMILLELLVWPEPLAAEECFNHGYLLQNKNRGVNAPVKPTVYTRLVCILR